MIKKTIYALSLIAILATFISLTDKPKEEKEAAVKLTVNEWAVVLSGVAKLPLEQSQNIYMKIITQVNQQMDSVKKK